MKLEVGNKVDRLEIVTFLPDGNCLCKCDCDNYVAKKVETLKSHFYQSRSMFSVSCGCAKKEKIKSRYVSPQKDYVREHNLWEDSLFDEKLYYNNHIKNSEYFNRPVIICIPTENIRVEIG